MSISLTVDIVVFGLHDGPLEILLIRRGVPPFEGDWALPGGFVRGHEELHDAARRELAEETGVGDVYLEQLYTFGRTDRDPRGRVVSVAYFALVKLADHNIRATTDAAEARWFSVQEAPPLAFDHADILAVAHERLRGKLTYQPIGFELLPDKFKLSQLRQLYETILGRPLDKRNFRKKVLRMGVLTALDEREQNVSHRAAQFYRFDSAAYKRLHSKGFEL
jgi:8-oxo-dGTP diphosphatase